MSSSLPALPRICTEDSTLTEDYDGVDHENLTDVDCAALRYAGHRNKAWE